jgi:hypothetical protein
VHVKAPILVARLTVFVWAEAVKLTRRSALARPVCPTNPTKALNRITRRARDMYLVAEAEPLLKVTNLIRCKLSNPGKFCGKSALRPFALGVMCVATSLRTRLHRFDTRQQWQRKLSEGCAVLNGDLPFVQIQSSMQQRGAAVAPQRGGCAVSSS